MLARGAAAIPESAADFARVEAAIRKPTSTVR